MLRKHKSKPRSCLSFSVDTTSLYKWRGYQRHGAEKCKKTFSRSIACHCDLNADGPEYPRAIYMSLILQYTGISFLRQFNPYFAVGKGATSSWLQRCRFRKFYQPVLLCLALLLGLGASSISGYAAPKLACDEPEYQFGELDSSETVKHNFVIRNEGDEPLRIIRVRPDCGCTLVKLKDKTLAPGEQTTLSARLSLKGRHGKQRKRITLETNDPSQTRFVLYMTGHAVARLEVRPARLYWGNIRQDAAVEKTVDIVFRSKDAFHVKDVKSPSPAFTVTTENIDTGKSYKVRIALVPPLPLGRFQFPVIIKTDHPRYPEIKVPMQGRVVGDIFTIPAEIVLEPDTNQPVSRLLIVSSSLKKDFRVLQVIPPASNIQVNIGSTVLSRHRIQLKNIIPSQDMNGQCLKIITDCDTMKEVSVPICIKGPDKALQ